MAGKALYLIAAMERKQGIGFKNDLPWHLEREYAYFERMSTVTQQPNKMVIISLSVNWTPHVYVLSVVYGTKNAILCMEYRSARKITHISRKQLHKRRFCTVLILFVSINAKFGICTVVGLKCVFCFNKCPIFRLTTVQIPNLELIEMKRITVRHRKIF